LPNVVLKYESDASGLSCLYLIDWLEVERIKTHRINITDTIQHNIINTVYLCHLNHLKTCHTSTKISCHPASWLLRLQPLTQRAFVRGIAEFLVYLITCGLRTHLCLMGGPDCRDWVFPSLGLVGAPAGVGGGKSPGMSSWG